MSKEHIAVPVASSLHSQYQHHLQICLSSGIFSIIHPSLKLTFLSIHNPVHPDLLNPCLEYIQLHKLPKMFQIYFHPRNNRHSSHENVLLSIQLHNFYNFYLPIFFNLFSTVLSIIYYSSSNTIQYSRMASLIFSCNSSKSQPSA